MLFGEKWVAVKCSSPVCYARCMELGNAKSELTVKGMSLDLFKEDSVRTIVNLQKRISFNSSINLNEFLKLWRLVDVHTLTVSELNWCWTTIYAGLPKFVAKNNKNISNYAINQGLADRMARVTKKMETLRYTSRSRVPSYVKSQPFIRENVMARFQPMRDSCVARSNSVFGILAFLDIVESLCECIDFDKMSEYDKSVLQAEFDVHIPRLIHFVNLAIKSDNKPGRKVVEVKRNIASRIEILKSLASSYPMGDVSESLDSLQECINLPVHYFDDAELESCWVEVKSVFGEIQFSSLSEDGKHFVREAVDTYLPSIFNIYDSFFRGSDSPLTSNASEAVLVQLKLIRDKFAELRDAQLQLALENLSIQKSFLSKVVNL